MDSSTGTLYCIMIRFINRATGQPTGDCAYYNGKPAHYQYHTYTRLGAKKWRTSEGAHRAMAKIPQHDNQEIFVSEV